MDFFTILTKKGLEKLSKSISEGKKVVLSKMAVGDGSGDIKENMTALLSQKHIFAINSVIIDSVDSNLLVVEGVINADTGGFYIREAGLFCDDGTLFAVAKLPENYKPLLSEGSAKDVTIKFYLQVSNAASITLKVDNNQTFATRAWVISNYYTKNECDEKFAPKDKFELDRKWINARMEGNVAVIEPLKARYFRVNVTQDTRIVFEGVPEDADTHVCVFFIELTNAGNHTITWNETNIRWNNEKTPVFAANKVDILGFLLARPSLFGFRVGKDMRRD